MNDKKKVGRPKLADNKLKKSAIVSCIICLITLVAFIIIGANILYKNISFTNLKGSTSNDCELVADTSSNKATLNIKCNQNAAAYKINVLDNTNTFIGKVYYDTNKFGVNKTTTLKLSNGKYNLEFYTKDKEGNVKSVKKSIEVPGQVYNNAFGFDESKLCKISSVKILDEKIDANISCGSKALAYEVHLINKTEKKDSLEILPSYFKNKGKNGYGVNDTISIKYINKNSSYAVRLMYKLDTKENTTGISAFVVTSNIVALNTNTTTTIKETTSKTSTNKINDKCYISKLSSAKNSNTLKYQLTCTKNAKVVNTAYKVEKEALTNRKGKWGAEISKSSSIVFRQDRMGKKIYLRVYYSKDKYDERSIKLGSGKTYKFNLSGPITTTSKATTSNITTSKTTTKTSSTKKSDANVNNYIVIGDSRTSGMYAAYSGKDLDLVNKVIQVSNKKVRFIGKVSAGYDYWFNNATNYNKIKDALSKAEKGTKVIIWLGVNDCGYNKRADKYATKINDLASKYTNLDFVYYSITAVNETKYKGGAKNSVIKKFNSDLSSSLKNKSRYGKNLSYKNIYNRDVKIGDTTKSIYHFVVDDTTYARDGIHYAGKSGTLYKKILELMMK